MDTTNMPNSLLGTLPYSSDVINKSLCNISSPNQTECISIFNNITTFDTPQAYLERSLGFLIIGIIGIVANLFVIIVLGSSMKLRQKLVNTLIIHQSFVDFLSSVALVGTAHLDGEDKHGLTGVHADIYCFFLMLKWPLWVLVDVSSFSLVFLNIERYISIVYPIYHHTKVTRKRVVKLLPIVWLLGILEQCLISLSFYSVNGACGFVSMNMVWVSVITFVVVHFFLPVMLVIFLYGHMIIRLRSSMVSTSVSTRRNDVMEKAKNNVFKTMLLISICYAVCYGFNSIYATLFVRGIINSLSGKSQDSRSQEQCRST